MKSLTVFILTLVLIAAMAVTNASAQEVHVPDVNLAAAIREALGLGKGARITAAAMRELTDLRAGKIRGGPRITVDLTGLQHATQLKGLGLEGSKVSDISPLANLTELRVLLLSGSKVSDIAALANLTNLERLWLDETDVSDIAALANLTNLEDLHLDDTWVSDIAALANLTKLKTLWLSDTDVSDIAALANLTKLKKLWLSDTDVSDISVLANLTNLETLGLNGTRVSDISVLAKLPNLETLGLRDNSLNAAAYDTHIPALQAKGIAVKLSTRGVIFWRRVHVPDVNLAAAIREALGLGKGAEITEAAMSKLTTLKISWTRVENLTGLESASNLERLSLINTKVTDISPLANLPKLEWLNLWGTAVSDISALANLTNLETLGLGGLNVSDISPLANLTNLETLYLNDTEVSDISPLANLTNLETLYLNDTEVSDISALANLPKLKVLHLNDTPLSAAAKTQAQAMWKKGIEVYGVEVDMEADLAKAIRERFNPAYSGTITPDILGRVTYLSLSNDNVSDISALVHCPDLEYLYLENTKVSDIAALANLTKLRKLDLANTKVSDIAALANLTKLESLYLNNTKVSDIAALANLTKLESLWLNNTRVSDVSPLTKLTNLEYLEIEGARLSAASYKVLNAMRADGRKVYAGDKESLSVVTIDGLWIPFGKKLPDKGGNRFIILTQYGNNCGPTSLEMVLHYYSKITPLDEIRDAGGIHEVWVGTWPSEMEQALNELGVPAHWYDEDTGNFKDDPFSYLRYFVREDQPSCILIRYRNNEGNIRYHWVVVVGYNTETNEYLLADPAKDKYGGAFRWVSRSKLDKWWGFKSLDKGDVSYWDEVWDEELGELVSPIVAGGFDPFGFATSFAADPYTVIRPTSAPTILVKNLRTEYGGNGVTDDGNGPKGFHRVKGEVKPGLERDWSETIYFNKPFDFYRVSAIRVDWAKFNFGGTAKLTGHRKIGNAVKIWGRVSDGLVVRGVLDVLVRPYYDVDAVRSEIIGAPAQLALPAETSLLPNYPNPFNPETWIPYQLSEAAEVTVAIHASDGKLVRTLELGQVPAGVYSDRGRAAYWDGRNAAGEPVASGVYFYTLKAGEFSATRKMVIRK